MEYVHYSRIMSKEFCNKIIQNGEIKGFKRQKCFIKKLNKHVFSNKRKSFVIKYIDDSDIKFNIKKQLELMDPRKFSNLIFMDNIRLIKYNKGGYFNFHKDKEYKVNGKRSYTMLLYLNHNYIKGNTILLNDKTRQGFEIEKITGSVLIFNPNITHSGTKVVDGKKYILSVPILLDENVKIN